MRLIRSVSAWLLASPVQATSGYKLRELQTRTARTAQHQWDLGVLTIVS